MFGTELNAPVVGITATADGQGYWLLAKDGGVFTFNAPFYGSTGNMKLNKPVVGWLCVLRATGTGSSPPTAASSASVGRPFFGSTGDRRVAGQSSRWRRHRRAAATTSWASTDRSTRSATQETLGGVKSSPSPIVGIGVRPQGDGYWLVAADGTVTGLGAAASIGASSGNGTPAAPAAATVGISVTASGGGYRLVRADGSTVGAGDAA